MTGDLHGGPLLGTNVQELDTAKDYIRLGGDTPARAHQSFILATDSEFIYSTLVPVLRKAKERRQIIIVTHNANIPVLSDAEQIIVLKSTSDKAMITNRGSIDDAGTRDAACEILEGAPEAFRLRARLYGMT